MVPPLLDSPAPGEITPVLTGALHENVVTPTTPSMSPSSNTLTVLVCSPLHPTGFCDSFRQPLNYCYPFQDFFFFFFCSCKVSIDVSVIHYIFLFVVCLFYFKCPGAPWRWPSHIKTSTCLVLHSAKHDSYLFSKLLPFSVMWDRSPSNRFLTHLLACAWTANPLALMMKMI